MQCRCNILAAGMIAVNPAHFIIVTTLACGKQCIFWSHSTRHAQLESFIFECQSLRVIGPPEFSQEDSPLHVCLTYRICERITR